MTDSLEEKAFYPAGWRQGLNEARGRRRINSAIDNPANYFTASTLDLCVCDINDLLDGIGNGVQGRFPLLLANRSQQSVLRWKTLQPTAGNRLVSFRFLFVAISSRRSSILSNLPCCDANRRLRRCSKAAYLVASFTSSAFATRTDFADLHRSFGPRPWILSANRF
jgi:hypothetical protein